MWRSGTDVDVALSSPVYWAWHGQSLGMALENLAHAQRLALFRDRRVDPERSVDFTAVDQTLESALGRLAAELDLGISRVGDVVYLGPRDTAQRLRTVAWLVEQQVERLPAPLRRAWARKQPLFWPEGALPRELVRALARDAGARVENLDALPHDVWPGASFPSATLADRLTLVLAGFHATVELDETGKALRMVPIPDHVEAERRIPAPRQPEASMEQWRARLPRARVTLAGDQLVLRGLIEDLQWSPPARLAPVSGSTSPGKAYRLTVRVEDEPLEPLMAQLCQKLALSLHWDRERIAASGRTTEVTVSCDVRQGTLHELLAAILHPVELDFRLVDRERRLTVIPLGAD